MFVLRTLGSVALGVWGGHTISEPNEQAQRAFGVGHGRLIIEKLAHACAVQVEFAGEDRPSATVAEVRFGQGDEGVPERCVVSRAEG